MRRRRNWCSQAKVRSTTQHIRPTPEPWSVARRADDRVDAAGPQLAAVIVVVIAAVGDQAVGALAWPPGLAADRADTVDQRQQLGDVVSVAAGQRGGQGIPEGSTIR
jgi:hypothetical protein